MGTEEAARRDRGPPSTAGLRHCVGPLTRAAVKRTCTTRRGSPRGGSPSRTMLPWGLRCLTGSPRRSSMATAGLLAQPPSRAQRRARPRQRVWMCPEGYHNLVGLKRGVTVVWGWLWGWMCNFRSPRFTYLALCVGHRAPLSSVHINWSM